MFKKMIAALALVGFLATSSIAQEESATIKGTSDNTFAISLHPITMLVYSVVLDLPSLYVTMENAINSNLSIITRPYYLGANISDDDEEIDIDLFGLSEGVRFYFNRGHQGLFAAFHVLYEYVSLEYTYDSDSRWFEDENIDVTGNGLGIGFYIGSKSMWGHFTTSWDIGVTYMNAFVKGKSKDDVEEVSDNGIGLDINYTMGFAL